MIYIQFLVKKTKNQKNPDSLCGRCLCLFPKGKTKLKGGLGTLLSVPRLLSPPALKVVLHVIYRWFYLVSEE
jgi:hypothetical protein